ncbi:MAG: monovalent cation/H+ antiporter subunit D family protein [bacterium]|nr:monovalent cation/H+ antiporter subunit D family protein [bacterium]
MNSNIPVLVLASPLLGALAVNLLGKISKKHVTPWTLGSLVLSAAGSYVVLAKVLRHGTFTYTVGGWNPPYGIQLVLDPLSAIMLAVVSTVALIATGVALPSIKKEMLNRSHLFFSLYLILVSGMMGLVITGDAFNLYVLLEIVSITSYGLIAMGKGGRAPLASFNYIIMGTIGACFYLLGVGYLYLMTGTLNMEDIASSLSGLYGSPTVAAAFCFIMIGLLIKMGFFPLHGWLPNAYSYAPVGASVLIAPLMTKITVYLMIRILFRIFTPDFIFAAHSGIRHLVVWVAALGVIAASVIALNQKNFVRMLTYVIIAEVGYMVGGIWLGNTEGLTGTIFHIINDAFMTVCFFSVAAALLYRVGTTRIENLHRLFEKMPLTMAVLVVGALSVVGVPPLCGFFSKWYLLLGGFAAHHYGFVIALIFSSAANAVLFFRVLEAAFSKDEMTQPEDAHAEEGGEASGREDAPAFMIPSLVAVAVALILLGLNAQTVVSQLVQRAILNL